MTLRRSPSSFLGFFGTSTLVAGTLAGIAPGCLTDPDKCTIILSRNTPGGTLGFLTAPVANRAPTDTTFTITSTNAADTSTVNWLAIPKNTGNGASTTFDNNASLRRGPSGLGVLIGQTTLVAGTKTVTGIPLKAGAKIFVMAQNLAGTSGKLSVPDATVDVTLAQFVINSNQAADTSLVGYVVVNNPLRFSPSGKLFSQSKGALSGTTAFTDMEQSAPFVAGQADAMVVLASVITASASANLGAPTGVRTLGTISVNSSGADGSLIEVCAF